jgi:hypothetical protein
VSELFENLEVLRTAAIATNKVFLPLERTGSCREVPRCRVGLGFIPEFAQRWPLLHWALEHQYKRSRVPVDLTKGTLAPALTPKLAFEAERNQIETVLGLTGLVALTDHDNIAAPTLLRMAEETTKTHFGLESTVPFGEAIFHLGIHNCDCCP